MRLFFALWPAPEAAARLAALAIEIAASHDGRAMPLEKIHLTLVFLGEVPDDRVTAALEAAREAPLQPFAMAFDRLGGFRRSKVGWAGMSRVPVELVQWQSRLQAQLQARGFVVEERPFAPHVTLARKVARPVALVSMEPIAWEAREVALLRTEPGSGEYTTLARVPGMEI
jgi:RNA 2',3'-cyclic 3'-phosphodiesterase